MSLQKKIVYFICEVMAFMLTCWFCFFCLYPLIILMFITKLYMKEHKIDKKNNQEITVGIFHPYCNAGAGGERVLWSVIKTLQSNYKNLHIFIYTGDLDYDRETILDNVKKVFDLKMQDNINIVYLHRRKWIEDKMFPFCTLFGQGIGSIWLGWEALTLFKPDIYIDTMGYAFTYPLFKYYGSCKVISYTHYPIISTDMIKQVSQRSISYNNCSMITRNSILTIVKLGYYKAISFLYGLAGRTADVVMVNSSWTKAHINSIWKCPKRTFLLYPPCDVEKLIELPLLNELEKNNEIRIVSISQFRPEKNHTLMIKVMKKLKSLVDDENWKKLHLILVGSCRDKGDKSYVDKLKKLAATLSIENNIEFHINLQYSQLISEMQKGTIGIHAMWNEHFGISVVDSLAAGLIMIASASGGPKYDIINTTDKMKNGYLAKGVDDYVKTIISILSMTTEEKSMIQSAARNSVLRFSSKCFEQELLKIMNPFFKLKQR